MTRHNHIKFMLAVILLAIPLVACNAQEYETEATFIDQAATEASEDRLLSAGGESQLPADASSESTGESDSVVPGEKSPDAVEGEDDDDASPEDSQIVSSDGQTLPPPQSDGKSGSAPSQAPGSEAVAAAPDDSVGPVAIDDSWKMYRNDAFGFEIHHPAEWAPFTPPASTEAVTPQPVLQISFQYVDMIEAGTADIEVPQLTIVIYDNSAQLSTRQWLEANGLYSASDEISSFEMADSTAVKICSSLLLAPGCSTYLTQNGYVYQFIPLTDTADVMMASFTFVE